jgi:hypothetical protein
VQLLLQLWVVLECGDRLPSASQLTSALLALLSLSGTAQKSTQRIFRDLGRKGNMSSLQEINEEV